MAVEKQWILCPACGGKTRVMMCAETELKQFPLYCPKCRTETMINLKDFKIEHA